MQLQGSIDKRYNILLYFLNSTEINVLNKWYLNRPNTMRITSDLQFSTKKEM